MGSPSGDRPKGRDNAGKAGEIQPLAEAHGVSIIVRIAGAIIAGAVRESGGGGNGREKNGDIAELAKEIGAEVIAFGASIHERYCSVTAGSAAVTAR